VLIDSEGRVAVVDTGGPCFLPGGGIEAGESPMQALARELLEELGAAAQDMVEIAAIREHLFSWKQKRYFTIDGTYYHVHRYEIVGRPTDTSHAVRWLAPGEASRRLERPGQRWVASRFALGGSK
jgi:8-oxo-dGTP diphosphatase